MAGVARRIGAGVVAGLAGTLAMDLVWYRRYRRGGGEDGFADWEFATSTTSFEAASAPGQVGQRLAGLVGVALPDRAAGLTTNVVHWATGLGYGLAHGVLQHRRPVVVGGVTTGAGAFATSYATLGTLGVYEPIWTYDAATLRDDLTAHLVFGAATSAAYRVLAGPPA